MAALMATHPHGLAARRPLASVSGGLAGFSFAVEIPLPSATRNEADLQQATTAAANLLLAMRETVQRQQIALAELPASVLGVCLGDGLLMRGMYLVLGADALFADAEATGTLIQRTRAAGVRLGWRLPQHALEPVPPGRPDFLPLVGADHSSLEGWRDTIAEGAHRYPDVPQVLLDLPDVATMDALLGPPVALACCRVGVCEAPDRALALPRSAQRLLRGLSAVVRRNDNPWLVQQIESDPVLHRQLLDTLTAHRAPSLPGIASLEQALAQVGREGIYHGLARLVMDMAPARQAAAVLKVQALARARLLELLAKASAEPYPGDLYLMGLASMLPRLLQCDIDDVLAPLVLPHHAITALGEHGGPWMRPLALVRALERHDLMAAEALALPLGGLPAVLAMANRAWDESL